MKILTKTIKSEKEMFEFGKEIGFLLPEKVIILLDGPLGVGKTTFTKGLGKALNIQETIKSPTFTLVKSYSGSKDLHHLDAYRLQDTDIEYIMDLIESDAIIVIEWSDNISGLFKPPYLKFNFDYKDNERVVSLFVKGKELEDLIYENISY